METITAVGDDEDQALIAARNEAAEMGGDAVRRISSERKKSARDMALYGVLASKSTHLTAEVCRIAVNRLIVPNTGGLGTVARSSVKLARNPVK